jgi:acetylornithine/N-succinyldiaminopimelate aminotransferase
MKDAFVRNPPFPKNYADEFLVLDHGKGSWVWDREGKRYLDFSSGIAVTALGHGRRDLARIAAHQMKKLTHVSNLFTTEPALKLANRLVTTGDRLGGRGFSAVHLGNSGTEANEAAIKYARVYALRTRGEGHHKLLSFTGAFHGRTLGSLSLTPTEKYQKPYHPLLPGVETAPYNDLAALDRLNEGYAAVFLEPLQGEGGLDRISPAFASKLQDLCHRYDILIVADEIQCGMGRTGTFFASEQLALSPDIVTLAKPLAGGLPLSATLIPSKVNSIIHVGDHGTTFGGGPVTSAVANRMLDVILNEKFLKSVQEKGQLFGELLEGVRASNPLVSEVKGMGLLRGLALNLESGDSSTLSRVILAAQRYGLLILRAGTNVLRLAPPLTVSPRELKDGTELLGQILSTLGSAP